MPLPAFLAGGALAGILIRALLWFFLAKGAAIVTRIMVTLGLAWATYEFVLDPIVTAIDNNVAALPSDLAVWARAFGFFEVISILISAEVIAAAKRVFLTRRA